MKTPDSPGERAPFWRRLDGLGLSLGLSLGMSLGSGAPAAIEGRHGDDEHARSYRLFRPARLHFGRRPLIVMLHGCNQDAHDFAAGTRLHASGRGRGCFVLYPAQDRRVNRMGCWSWFVQHPEHEDSEPALLAAMTRDIVARYPIDASRVYVAGLSAGGAMAAVLGATFPDLFAAVGVHSGLPQGAASGALSALMAMQHGPARRRGQAPGAMVPTIVFHGDQDHTVHPGNGAELIARVRASLPSAGQTEAPAAQTLRGEVPGGRAYTRTVHYDRAGRTVGEHWLIHGSGHAWSGGAADCSYTDPLGPDASSEMLRFFGEQRRRS